MSYLIGTAPNQVPVNAYLGSMAYQDSSQYFNVGQTVGFRNRIINGAMLFDQRNSGSAVTASNGYYLDRWWTGSISGATLTVQQVSDAPAGFTKSYKMTVTTSSTTSDYNDIRQRIEAVNCQDFDWGSSTGVPITISMWVKASVAGTYCSQIQFFGSSATYYYLPQYTINAANTWQYVTFTVPAPPTAAGAYTSAITSSYMHFSPLAMQTSGNSSSVAPNTWTTTGWKTTGVTVNFPSVSGATFQFTGVQLEKGTTATSFDWRPYITELQLCQRYCVSWQNNSDIAAIGTGAVYSTSAINMYAMLPVQMRAAPTATTVAYGGVWLQSYQGASGYTTNTAPSVGDFTGNSVRLYCGGFSASFTVGYATWNHVVRYAQLLLTAEL